MAISKKQAFWAAIGSDLKVFLLQAFKTIHPRSIFMDNWHIDAIIHALTLSINGKMPRLIINLPPRQLKSFIASVVLPAFVLGRDPTAKIICLSYSDELARTLARDFRRIIESEWYRTVFPQVRFSKVTENEITTNDGGFRYAISVGGSLTGRGADFIVIDDPIKPEDARSDKARESINDWYRSTLLSRLDDKSRSVLIIVMQRLHVNDLTGFAEAAGGFHKIAFPAIAIRDESIPTSPTGHHVRREGEPLHQEREGLDLLKNMRHQIGTYNFCAQYQQQPEVPDGTLFKRKCIKVITDPNAIRPGGAYWVSIDSASSTSETADYSAISLIYTVDTCFYVLYAERGHWDYEMLLAKARGYAARYRDVTFVVEAASSGISLIQSLRKLGITCLPYRPKHDKMTRAAYVLPIFSEGRVRILSEKGKNAWVESYINELVSFPFAPFNDQVDSLVQALMFAELRVNPGGRICLV